MRTEGIGYNIRRSFVLGLGLSLTLSGMLGAYCEDYNPTVEKDFEESELVVICRVISEKHVQPREAMDYFLYKVKVVRVFKGDPNNGDVWIFTENASGRYPLVKGGTWVLFGSKMSVEDRRAYSLSKTKNVFEISNCENNANILEADELIKKLEMLATKIQPEQKR